MNRQEFAVLTDAMKTFYPRDPVIPNKQAMSLWYGELKDLTFDQAMAALKVHVHRSKWAPTIHELRQAALENQTEIEDWSKGWQLALRAVGRYGIANGEEALASLPEHTRETVRRLGWKDLCLTDSEDLQNYRANFRKVYKIVAEKAAEQDRMPEELKAAISRIGKGEEERIGTAAGQIEGGANANIHEGRPEPNHPGKDPLRDGSSGDPEASRSGEGVGSIRGGYIQHHAAEERTESQHAPEDRPRSGSDRGVSARGETIQAGVEHDQMLDVSECGPGDQERQAVRMQLE